jgi:hypothetical protein
MHIISPSVELASKMLPLKPHDRSVTPSLNASITIVIGLAIYGFHTEIVDSALARAIIL